MYVVAEAVKIGEAPNAERKHITAFNRRVRSAPGITAQSRHAKNCLASREWDLRICQTGTQAISASDSSVGTAAMGRSTDHSRVGISPRKVGDDVGSLRPTAPPTKLRVTAE